MDEDCYVGGGPALHTDACDVGWKVCTLPEEMFEPLSRVSCEPMSKGVCCGPLPGVRLEFLSRVSCRSLSGQCRGCVLRSIAGREARVDVEGELLAFVEEWGWAVVGRGSSHCRR